MRTDAELVTLTTHDGVAVVRFDDGKVNAVSLAACEALRSAFATAATEARAIVLSGRPGFLSAGLDLAVVQSGDVAAFDRLLAAGGALYLEMLRSPVPIVAACDGHAIAAGALLLLCSDHRVGGRTDYRIGVTEVSIGVALPVLGSSLATLRLNRRYLHRAAVLAERFDPETAVDAGFLDELADDAVAVAVERARELAELDRTAYVETKRRIAEIAAGLAS